MKKEKYKNDPEHREKSNAWGKRNRDKKNEITARWRRNNPEKRAAWKEKNLENIAANDRNRRARKRNAEGSHTPADIARIRKMQRDKCGYCRKSLGGKGHIDHIISLVNGGGNSPRNLQLLCAKCNHSKHSKDPIHFARLSGLLV